MRILSLNIEGPKHLDRVVPFLNSQCPDIACLQELSDSDIPTILSQTNLKKCHFVAMARHPALQPDQRGGVGIFSRYPFIATNHLTYAGQGKGDRVVDLANEETRFRTCRYVVALVKLDINGIIFRIGTTHFPWTSNGQPTSFQWQAAHNLISLLNDQPIVLTGDFNAPRGGPIFELLAEKWTDWIPPYITTSLDPELHYAAPLELMVDGLFTSPHYQANSVAFHDGLSDHQAIIAELATTASNALRNN
ncbi:MAG: endonuclease/exonuclease/phosphatase family protein [Pseudomonadota bacterium]